MSFWKRVCAGALVGTVVTYYSPWVHSSFTKLYNDSWAGRSWEMIKKREDQFRTLRWMARPVREPWWNASRSRLNYYLYGPDTMTPVGGYLPTGRESVEEFIEYEKKARIRPLGPWFDAFSDPRSMAVLDEYSKGPNPAPALMMDRLEKAPSRHYKTSFGGASYPEGRPRGASIASFLFDCEGFEAFYDDCRRDELNILDEIEMRVPDPKTREMMKSMLSSFRLYWAEQLEEYLPYIACRPAQKQKLANYLMNCNPYETGHMMMQKEGFKKVLLAAGCDLKFE